MKDSFGDRMKFFEGFETSRKLLPMIPSLARVDGKCFHNFTKGMNRPYDENLSNLMIETTKFLVEETNACMGYTQSDEITLTWLNTDFNSQIFFDGKIQKMVSVITSLTTAFFNNELKDYFPDLNKIACFDCRVWNVPSKEEGANVFLWREKDAYKNSVSMAARHYYSHKDLENKNNSEMQEMLWAKNVNYNDYPRFFKRGQFIQKRKVSRKFTSEEIEKLPMSHNARANPDLEVERAEIVLLEMPPFSTVINRKEVIYDGVDPIYCS